MIKFSDIFKLAKPYRLRLIAFFIFNGLTSLFNVFSIGMVIPFLKVIFRESQKDISPVAFSYNPEQMLKYFDYSISQKIVEWGASTALLYFSLGIIVAFLLKNVSLFLSFYNLAYVRSAVVRDIRERTYNRLINLPLKYFGTEKRGDIISKLTNDVKEIEWSLLGVLEMIFKHPISILIPLVILFITSVQLTLFVMIVLPISGYLISLVGKKLKHAAAAGQSKLAEVVSHIEESMHGIKIIKAFSAEGAKRESFKKLNDDHFWLMVKLHRKEFLASPLSEFMGSIVIAGILIFGGNLILTKESALTGSLFIGYIAVFSQLIPPSKAITEAFFRLKKGAASLDRINEILEEPQESTQNTDYKDITSINSIKFESVYFNYVNQKNVINGLSFEIQQGKTVALVGPSGGGKSTIADLIPRFIIPSGGKILINDIDIANIPLKVLRKSIGVVTQDAILFNDTFEGNIRIGHPEATMNEIIEASKVANAFDFIEKSPQGWQTNLGEKGGALSGGQRQRISIARAVIKNPPLLILDEATSALDTESENVVQDALDKVMKNRTSIVIAHRLSTIQKADKIFVIDQGKIVESGKHAELLAANGLYAKLVSLQTFS